MKSGAKSPLKCDLLGICYEDVWSSHVLRRSDEDEDHVAKSQVISAHGPSVVVAGTVGLSQYDVVVASETMTVGSFGIVLCVSFRPLFSRFDGNDYCSSLVVWYACLTESKRACAPSTVEVTAMLQKLVMMLLMSRLKLWFETMTMGSLGVVRCVPFQQLFYRL